MPRAVELLRLLEFRTGTGTSRGSITCVLCHMLAPTVGSCVVMDLSQRLLIMEHLLVCFCLWLQARLEI
jgi:hypothetical protein